MITRKALVPILLLIQTGLASAQNFHAIQGSSFAGSLGVHNNPASIVNTPFKWDVTLIGAQVKSSTNTFGIYNYSLLSSPANSQYAFSKGDFARFSDFNYNTPVLNARVALSRTKSIAFGANLRGYGNLSTSPFNFIDTLKGVSQFFRINQQLNNLNVKFTSSSWAEIFASYAQTIFDNNRSRLNVGVTLKAMRGYAGGYLRLASNGFTTSLVNNKTVYDLKATSLSYTYSRNFDTWDKALGTGKNLKNFLTFTEGGLSLDVGAELLIKSQEVVSFNDDRDTYFDYDWKFGVSLLDAGFNQYTPGKNSGAASAPDGALNNVILDQKFGKVINFQSAVDSLKSISAFQSGYQKFNLINPMRLVLNADRYLGGDFYANAEMSMNLSPLAGNKRIYVKEFNFLTITPRWERQNLGAYLPIQFNDHSQFWVGAAIKAGPLLLGIHNVGNLFSKTKTQNGGGYIALVIRPLKTTGVKPDKRLDCPKE